MKKEIQAGKSYDSKRRNALKHVRRAIGYFDLGKMDKARLWLLKTEKILDEFKHEYDLASIDQTSVVKFKEVIQLEEDIDSATEDTEAPKAIEVLTEVVNEIYDDEAEEQTADGSEEDYSSQTKKDSRTFAFSRTDISGNPITKAIKCGLFITHTKMRDIVQAWNEGLVDKNTQLVLVTSGSDVVDGKKVKVVNHISENFDKQLEETTKEMCYDEVPNFIKRPRFWGRAITSLKVDSKSSLNEDGLVWGDLKGSIQYAFLDYCGINNMKYLNWYGDVLYEMLANNYNLAINHFSYVRNDKTNWKSRCFSFLSTTSTLVDAIACQRYMEDRGLLEGFLKRYERQIEDFDTPLEFMGFLVKTLLEVRKKQIEDRLPHLFNAPNKKKNYDSLRQEDQHLYHEYKSIQTNNVIAWEFNNSSKSGVGTYDGLLIDSFLWKSSYLDSKHPNSVFTNPYNCWFMRLMHDYINDRISHTEYKKALEEYSFEGMGCMSYSGNNPSSKMTIHKFTGSKKPVFRYKSSMEEPLKRLHELRDNTTNPFRASMVIGRFDEGDAHTTELRVEDYATLKIQEMTDHQSRKFINDYCVKRMGYSPESTFEMVTLNHSKRKDSIALVIFSQALANKNIMDEAVFSALVRHESTGSLDHEGFPEQAIDMIHDIKKEDGSNDDGSDYSNILR